MFARALQRLLLQGVANYSRKLVPLTAVQCAPPLHVSLRLLETTVPMATETERETELSPLRLAVKEQVNPVALDLPSLLSWRGRCGNTTLYATMFPKKGGREGGRERETERERERERRTCRSVHSSSLSPRVVLPF